MQYRSFGNTGKRISILGFGAMRLPMTPDGEHIDEEEAIPIIQRAYDLGITYFDTAPYYCKSESEIVLGKAIKPWRDEIILSTKCPIKNADGAQYRENLETSLRKLDVEYIDFYHMWGINWKSYEENIIAPGGPLDEARKAKEEGLIRHISFSFHDTPEALERLIDTGNFESMTVQYNLLDRANEQGIHLAREKGLGVVIMGPVGGGRLAGFSPEIAKMVPGGIKSNPEIALRFVFSHPDASCAISGMGSIQMVEENVATASREEPLSDQERAQIMAALDETKRLTDLYCTACEYCMPCPNDVNISHIFELCNMGQVYRLWDIVRERYWSFPNQQWIGGKQADACIECGECEEKCPQNIQIIDQLKGAHKALAGSE